MSTMPSHLSEFCAEQPVQTGEPLSGTAADETTIWLVLEYPEPWAANAIGDNHLPPPVQAWLDAQIAAVPHSRLLFIKQETRPATAERRFYVAITREQDQRLYQFVLPDYGALLELDVAAVIAGTGMEAHRCPTPLYLVCTNGKRDRCCAKFGLPIYQQLLAQLDAEQVWQCTHIGGHRYAATAAILPHGVYYGQINPSTIPALITATSRGQVSLLGYRGRTCYPAAVQAADYYLRRHTGQMALDAFALVAAVAGENPSATFRDPAGAGYTVHLQTQVMENVLAGCSKQKYESQTFYHLSRVVHTASGE